MLYAAAPAGCYCCGAHELLCHEGRRSAQFCCCSWSLFIKGYKSHTFFCPGLSLSLRKTPAAQSLFCFIRPFFLMYIYNIRYTLLLLVYTQLLGSSAVISPVHWWNHNQRLVSPRGVISLNTSVSYLIEPLPTAGDAQPHAVYRAESLRLGGGSCPHHHGNTEHGAGPDDFIHGMTSSFSGRVSLDGRALSPASVVLLLFMFQRCDGLLFSTVCSFLVRKKETWAGIWSM